MKKLMAIVVTVAGLAASTSAPAANMATATATANLVTAISIVKTTDLNFGQIVPGGTAGSVVMAPDSGVRSPTGGTTLGNAGSASRATYTVTGAANGSFAITASGSITISDGTNSMLVSTFQPYPSWVVSLSAGGTATIYIGATLNVPANQVFTGTPFTGTFNTTVNYN